MAYILVVGGSEWQWILLLFRCFSATEEAVVEAEEAVVAERWSSSRRGGAGSGGN
jgi:hypothetical protein